jgi:hypothetical protein
MKKILYLIVMVAIMALPACEGPEGPQGPPGVDGIDGEDGEDGIEVLNLVLEAQHTFSEDNGFSFTPSLEIAPGDNLLIFLEWAQIEEEEGATPSSLWRLLPQSVFFPEGAILTYNYQYTSNFFSVFMEGNFDLTELGAEWTDNQRLRIILLPGFFVEQNSRVDFSDYEAVMELIGKDESDIVPLELK